MFSRPDPWLQLLPPGLAAASRLSVATCSPWGSGRAGQQVHWRGGMSARSPAHGILPVLCAPQPLSVPSKVRTLIPLGSPHQPPCCPGMFQVWFNLGDFALAFFLPRKLFSHFIELVLAQHSDLSLIITSFREFSHITLSGYTPSCISL